LKKVNIIGLKGLYSFIFKVQEPKFIKVSTKNLSKFRPWTNFKFWPKFRD